MSCQRFSSCRTSRSPGRMPCIHDCDRAVIDGASPTLYIGAVPRWETMVFLGLSVSSSHFPAYPSCAVFFPGIPCASFAYRWFKFDLFITNLEVMIRLCRGHVNSPSQKGHGLNHLVRKKTPEMSNPQKKNRQCLRKTCGCDSYNIEECRN